MNIICLKQSTASGFALVLKTVILLQTQSNQQTAIAVRFPEIQFIWNWKLLNALQYNKHKFIYTDLSMYLTKRYVLKWVMFEYFIRESYLLE